MTAQSRARHLRRYTAKAPSIRDAATLFKCGKSQVGSHLKSLKETGQPAYSHRGVGRPRALLPSEDAALDAYAHWLIDTGSFASRDLLEDAANRLRER